jgi:hypothetical protein
MTSACYKLQIAPSASRPTGTRPSRLAQFYGRVAQKLLGSLAGNAYLRKTSKTRAKSERTNPANASCEVRPKAPATHKSP